MPPTSRPPSALGWPVTENGPIPGRPIRPVARWQFRIALTLSVPVADGLTPCEKTVTTFSVAQNSAAKAFKTAVDNPVIAGSEARAAASAASYPATCCRKSAFTEPLSAIATGKALNKAVSEPGGNRQMQIGDVAGGGAARVDDHDPHRRPGGLGGGEALIQPRMAPGEVGPGQHHQIGQFQILIQPRHCVGAKGPAVTRNGRGHAEP